MTNLCDRLEERLAESGAAGLRDDAEAAAHVASCSRCAALLDALARIERGLGTLPEVDATDALVQRTVAAIEGATMEGVALAAVASAPDPPALGARRGARVLSWIARRGSSVRPLHAIAAVLALVILGVAALPTTLRLQRAGRNEAITDMQETRLREGLALPMESNESAPQSPESAKETEQGQIAGGKGARGYLAKDQSYVSQANKPAAPPSPSVRGEAQRNSLENAQRWSTSQQNAVYGAPESDAAKQEYHAKKSDAKRKNRAVDALSSFRAEEKLVAELRADGPTDAPRRQLGLVATGRVAGLAASDGMSDDESVVGNDGQDLDALAVGDQARASADGFLNAREIGDDLTFQTASGYWANTYVPGDPVIRYLAAQCANDRSRFAVGGGLRLEALARQYQQPFDAPDETALAVYLRADRKGIQGPTRMLLQIGLQGTTRKSGLRPSMNVGVILDLREPATTETSAGVRALLTALAEAKQTGDRFFVVVAGAPGGMLVPAEEFHHGPIAVAMRRLFAGEAAPPQAPIFDLAHAASVAMATVAGADDPSQTLGASAVVLVTPSVLGSYAEPLEQLAHQSAVAGIPVSVVAVGGAVDPDEIDALTLAGQGNRRLLTAPAEATALIDRELHAVSRVIARAVRLRIRLAPGVRLIEVLGSHKLEEQQATRVREAERSIDFRLARNLGIEADRGEDEEGIQIVIPAYYAGDPHVILLDLVAEHEGTVADVTVRYKDLVHLRNGVARANLTLDASGAEPGPLERNVLKNLLGTQVAKAALDAGASLAEGDVDTARALLSAQAGLLEGVRAQVPGWSGDPEIASDARMLAEYLAALAGGAGGAEPIQRNLADSLQLAGHTKVQSRRQ